ncbi:MAG TPA: AMP-binding protein [Candidatus Dormibacteraeota bacterium]
MADQAPPPSLARLADEAFARNGDHDALIFEERTYRAAELTERARRAAAGLTALGVQQGDRVVVVMANCPEVLITYNAIWRAGAVVTPVVFLVPPAELQHILVDSGATAVVTTAELLGNVLMAADGVESVRHIVVAGAMDPVAAGDPRLVPFAALESHSEQPLKDVAASALAAVMYTGGTTGRAKGVMLTHHNLSTCGKSLWDVAHVPGITVSLTPLPLSHAYGMIVVVAGMHEVEPGLAVVQRWFNPAEWIALCERHRVQRSSLVPAMIQMLLAEPLEDADLSSLRYLGSGAAPLAGDVLREFERRVPGCEILEGYGCTESGAVISANPPGRRRVGSVGLPIRDYTVRVIDERDEPLPPGQDGEICVRGPGVMLGYWNAAHDTAAALRGDWLHTGDIGHVDGDGYLYIVDRKKDLILRGGFNVFPRDVEDVLLSHPDVEMAGVVGRPDTRLGEEVVAFVTLRAGATAGADDLVTFTRTRLAATKYPREVHVVTSIPLTSVGKLDRKALRAQLAGREARPT